jgi:hypothetical protein
MDICCDACLPDGDDAGAVVLAEAFESAGELGAVGECASASGALSCTAPLQMHGWGSRHNQVFV